MAERFDLDAWQQRMPSHRDEWAKLAADLDVRVIQISERDTERTATPEPEHADAALARHSSLADNPLNSLHAGRVLKDELVSGMEAVMGPVAVEAGT